MRASAVGTYVFWVWNSLQFPSLLSIVSRAALKMLRNLISPANRKNRFIRHMLWNRGNFGWFYWSHSFSCQYYSVRIDEERQTRQIHFFLAFSVSIEFFVLSITPTLLRLSCYYLVQYWVGLFTLVTSGLYRIFFSQSSYEYDMISNWLCFLFCVGFFLFVYTLCFTIYPVNFCSRTQQTSRFIVTNTLKYVCYNFPNSSFIRMIFFSFGFSISFPLAFRIVENVNNSNSHSTKWAQFY